jgi:hypothetical protein
MLRRLLCLPALLPGVAWGQDGSGLSTPETVGLGAAASLLLGLGALLRRQEFLALLGAIAGLVTGQKGEGDKIAKRLDAIEAQQTRTRRTVGLAADPEDPAPGTGLMVRVAALEAAFSALTDQAGRIEDLVKPVPGLLAAIESLAKVEKARLHGSHHAASDE